jgi:hypothetical protein
MVLEGLNDDTQDVADFDGRFQSIECIFMYLIRCWEWIVCCILNRFPSPSN